jgi:hypothetical protein
MPSQRAYYHLAVAGRRRVDLLKVDRVRLAGLDC